MVAKTFLEINLILLIDSFESYFNLPYFQYCEIYFIIEKILSFYSQDFLHLTIVVAVELVDFVVLVVLVGRFD